VFESSIPHTSSGKMNDFSIVRKLFILPPLKAWADELHNSWFFVYRAFKICRTR